RSSYRKQKQRVHRGCFCSIGDVLLVSERKTNLEIIPIFCINHGLDTLTVPAPAISQTSGRHDFFGLHAAGGVKPFPACAVDVTQDVQLTCALYARRLFNLSL